MKQRHNEIPECPFAPGQCPVADDYRRLKADNERLTALARIDELTGCYNYRHLKRALSAEMERTRRTGLETGVIIADLDRFKRVNDTYGHEAGNTVLKTVSRIWTDGIRQIDIACRYGGEEFVFILPGTRLHAVIGAAQRLRMILEATVVRATGHDIRLTASFGVDGYRIDDHALSLEALLDRADKHLLVAKNEGRNRVCFDRERQRLTPTEITEMERNALFSKPAP